MTERALELLCLPDEPCYLLDLGCGSGLSGECIEEQVIFIDDWELWKLESFMEVGAN